MALQSFVMVALGFNWNTMALAYPQAQNIGETQSILPRLSSNLLQQISVPTNSTNTPPLPPAPIGVIECFHAGQGRRSTDVDGCRPTLNYFRTFPNYRRIQDFMEGRYPKLPSTPPYAVHSVLSTCAIQIASEDPYTIDDFSFEQARALATEILEDCQDHGAYGGFGPIGHGVGWRVSVIGFSLPPDPPDRTGLLDGFTAGNGTSVPVVIVEA